MHFEGGKLKSITHGPTKENVAVDNDIGIDNTFELLHNWNDSQAELQKGKARRFKLRAFFGRGVGPNRTEPWSGKCKELASMAQEKLQDILATAAPTRKTDEAAARTFAEQRELKRKSATEKARAALMARNEEASKRRRISLGAEPPATPPVPIA